MKIRCTAFFPLLVLSLRLFAGPVLDGAYDSPKGFVKAVSDAKPATDHTSFTDIFQVRERGQPEDPMTGSLVRPERLICDNVLWENDAVAFVFVRAEPPTSATKSVMGVLFLLEKVGEIWQISDKLTSTQYGKYSNISTKVTPTKVYPIVAIKEVSGGRGHSTVIQRSFTFSERKIVVLDPKP